MIQLAMRNFSLFLSLIQTLFDALKLRTARPLVSVNAFQSRHCRATSILLAVALLISQGCGGGGASSENSNTAAPEISREDGASEDVAGEVPAGEEMAHPEGEIEATEPGASDPEMAGFVGESSSSGEMNNPEMAMEEGMIEPGSEGGFTGRPQKPPRPEKTSEWSPVQITEAISEGDAKVIEIINEYAEKKIGQASGVSQLATWIAALKAPQNTQQGNGVQRGGSSGEPGSAEMAAIEMEGFDQGQMGGQGRGPSGKEKIARALLDALAINGTNAANAIIAQVFSGSTDLGVDQGKAMEWSMVAMMKNLSPANRAAQELLLGALMLPVKATPETNEKNQKKEKPIQQRAKELHLGFAVAAMNSLIGADGPPPTQGRNNFMGAGSMEGSGGEMAMMEPGGQPQGGNPQGGNQPPAKPLFIPPVVLTQNEAKAAVSYLWGEQIVNFASTMLASNPDSTEALVLAGAIPLPETRKAVETVIQSHQNTPPVKWMQQKVFENQLTDPAIHVFVKSLPRELRPSSNNGGEAGARRPRPNRPGRNNDPDPEDIARKEARYAWMKASELTFMSLLDRMYQGAVHPDAIKYEEADLPFSVHRGAEVTTSLRFALPGDTGRMQNAEQTIVNYVRIESGQMNQKTVQHYRNSLRDENVVTILGGNGMWLDGNVKPNKKSGTIRSLDILLSKGNARPSISRQPQNQQAGNFEGGSSGFEAGAENFEPGGAGGSAGGTGGQFVVEILVVEIPAPAEEAEEENKVSATAK